MRGLMVTGIVLLAGGAIGLAALLTTMPVPELSSGVASGQTSPDTGPPVLLSIIVGVTLAAGGALLGIGMNRWRQGSPRTIQRPSSR